MNRAKAPKTIPIKKIRIRVISISLVFLLGFALIGARAFELHLTDNVKLNRLAKTQYKRKIVVAPKRGNIFDTHGETLAIDLRVDSVYGMPHRIQDPDQLAKELAPLLSLPKEKILKRISKKKKKFVWIKRRITQEESQRLKEKKLEGIGTIPEYKRFYPNGTLAANLLGAVGYDAKALSGLELTFDKTLKSEDPPLLVEQDAKGRSYAPYALVGLQHPKQITLTIDKTIQYITERELKAAVGKAKAKSGVAIVLDVPTGEILAMATVPTFDPNEYYKYDFKNWRNRAVTDIFEPGSVFKAFTAAAALETEVIKPGQKLNCENGIMKVGSHAIHDHHGYGLLSLSDIIKFSSNICSYKLAHRVGKKRFVKIIKEFGFGSKTNIQTPGEQAGLMASGKRLSGIQLGTMGFGQGISTTPLQIVMAYGAIGNGGYLMKPRLVKDIRDSDGKILKKFGPQIVRQVVQEDTAHQTIKLLETVVRKGGTGTRAALESYTVAGKTGTAQKVIEGHKGYAKNKYVASFIGMAPAEKPRLVILVSIDEPKGGYYGGLVSGPVFKQIMGQSLAYLKVPPQPATKSESPQKVAKKAPQAPLSKKSLAKKTQSKPDKKDNSPPITEKALSGDSQVIPDLTGLSVREALRKAHTHDFKIKIEGSGVCDQQEPAPGDPAPNGTSILLKCHPPDLSQGYGKEVKKAHPQTAMN